MTSTLDGLCNTALVFERCAGDSTWQDFALFVEELLEEFGILVVDVLDAALLEPAILLLLNVNGRSVKIADF